MKASEKYERTINLFKWLNMRQIFSKSVTVKHAKLFPIKQYGYQNVGF